MEQWVYWITRSDPEYGVPNIDWFIAVFLIENKDNVNMDPGINSWVQPLRYIKDLTKNKYNLKGALVSFPY